MFMYLFSLYELFRLFFFSPFSAGSVESDEFTILAPFLALKKRREKRSLKAKEKDKPKEDNTITTFALFFFLPPSRRCWKNNRRPNQTESTLRGKLLLTLVSIQGPQSFFYFRVGYTVQTDSCCWILDLRQHQVLGEHFFGDDDQEFLMGLTCRPSASAGACYLSVRAGIVLGSNGCFWPSDDCEGRRWQDHIYTHAALCYKGVYRFREFWTWHTSPVLLLSSNHIWTCFQSSPSLSLFLSSFVVLFIWNISFQGDLPTSNWLTLPWFFSRDSSIVLGADHLLNWELTSSW